MITFEYLVKEAMRIANKKIDDHDFEQETEQIKIWEARKDTQKLVDYIIKNEGNVLP